jgi:hypothetical protein
MSENHPSHDNTSYKENLVGDCVKPGQSTRGTRALVCIQTGRTASSQVGRRLSPVTFTYALHGGLNA